MPKITNYLVKIKIKVFTKKLNETGGVRNMEGI